MKIINDKKYVGKYPIITLILLEFGNVMQVVQMWRTKSAEDQSLLGWSAVTVALLLWLNFYRVMLDDNDKKFAMISTVLGIIVTLSVIFSVIYWRNV